MRPTRYRRGMGDSRGIVIGLLAAHEDRDLADALAADLPPALCEQVGGRRCRCGSPGG